MDACEADASEKPQNQRNDEAVSKEGERKARSRSENALPTYSHRPSM